MLETIVKTKNLFGLLDPEAYFVIFSIALFAWIFYKMFLTEVSSERHKNIQRHYTNLVTHLSAFTILFVTYLLLSRVVSIEPSFRKMQIYVGLFAFFWGIVCFVKSCRITVLQYLFLGSMRVGVPLLIVNIFSLVTYITLFFWAISYVFGVKLTPILATSAAFSIILGLALQDTLGNLFAGISLQIDKSFEIGSWLEIQNGSQKIIGQVQEITWRATILLGFTDELITIPNRVLAQAHISNFSNFGLPIVRRQVFRFDHGTDTKLAKQCISEALIEVPEVLKTPEPFIFIPETSESWIEIRAAYYIQNYGAQYSIGDKVVEAVLEKIKGAGLKLANPKMVLYKSES